MENTHYFFEDHLQAPKLYSICILFNIVKILLTLTSLFDYIFFACFEFKQSYQANSLFKAQLS